MHKDFGTWTGRFNLQNFNKQFENVRHTKLKNSSGFRTVKSSRESRVVCAGAF